MTKIWSVRLPDLEAQQMYKISGQQNAAVTNCAMPTDDDNDRCSLTSVTLKSRSNKKPGYHIMYPYWMYLTWNNIQFGKYSLIFWLSNQKSPWIVNDDIL
jgi:hypothetical protein